MEKRIGGPLEQLEITIKIIKDNAKNENKDPNNSKIILLTFPDIVDPKSQKITNKDDKRFPLTGTIDEIKKDVKRIKEIGIDHIIFGFNFSPTIGGIDGIIDIIKQLSKSAR